jgi:predicted SAM-dependent methyltransferase
MEKAMKINLACGQMYLNGWYNIDNNQTYPDAKVDLKQDAFEVDFQPDCADEILVSHFIPYIRPEHMPDQLTKWYKWLRVGGRLEIEASDFNYLVSLLKKDREYALTHIFGDIKNGASKWGWDAETMLDLTIKAGFKDCRIEPGTRHGRPHRDFAIIATK